MKLNSFQFDDMPTLHDKVCRRLFLGNVGEHYDWSGSSETGMTNVQLGAVTMHYDVDLSQLWLTEQRWRTMVRQYVDPDALAYTLGMVETHLAKKGKAKNGIATLRLPPAEAGYDDPTDDLFWSGDDDPGDIEMPTKLVKARTSGKQVARRWGSCMLSMTFRTKPMPTVTLNSRTTYFGYLAMMDMTVAQVFARMCAERVGIHVGEVQFVWNINLAQFHGFRSLAWAMAPDRKAVLDRYVDDRSRVPRGKVGLHRTLAGYGRILRSDRNEVLYGDESFVSFARVRRRFHAQIMGAAYARQFEGGIRYGEVARFRKLPVLNTSDLDFGAIGAH